MARITFRGSEAMTKGELPRVGDIAPDFFVLGRDLSVKKLSDYKGSRVVLNIFPSVDTKVCSASVRFFNQQVSGLRNTKVLCISKDLPFALGRFCGAEGIESVDVLSDFRGDFSSKYDLELLNTPFKGLLSRSIIVIDELGRVIYTEQVPETSQEPNYNAVINILR